MSRQRTRWSWSTGEYGETVLVFEERNGRLYGQIRGVRRALKHSDRERAKEWARDQEKKLREGAATAADPAPTVAKVCAAFAVARGLEEVSRNTRYEDKRCAALFTRVLGAGCDLSKLALEDWLRFIRDRQVGAIDGWGRAVPEPLEPDEPKRRPVGPRTVEADCEWLLKVCNWATEWVDRQTGRPLLREHPLKWRQFSDAVPHEENPRRPLATDDRYEAVQAVAAKVHPLLPAILSVVHETGRRIRAILALQHQDLLLAKGERCPYGRIRWRADEDKLGKEWVAPMNAELRAALDGFLTDRPAIGAVHLFPSPNDPTKPVSYELASKWLRKAERLAKQSKQEGSLWHAYRRGWATARKHLPVQDVAAAGGWSPKNPAALTTIYQQADSETTYRAVAEPMKLREARHG